jgi:hypothetical protein
MDKPDRVRVWNTFFKLAWTEAKYIFEERSQRPSSATFAPLGGTLPEDLVPHRRCPRLMLSIHRSTREPLDRRASRGWRDHSGARRSCTMASDEAEVVLTTHPSWRSQHSQCVTQTSRGHRSALRSAECPDPCQVRSD